MVVLAYQSLIVHVCYYIIQLTHTLQLLAIPMQVAIIL